MYIVRSPTEALLEKPSTGSEQTSECLWGETVERAGDSVGEWICVTRLVDGYSGYIRETALQATELDEQARPAHQEHRVVVRSTLLFSQSDIKSPVIHCLPLLARVQLAFDSDPNAGVNRKNHPLRQTSEGYFVIRDHVQAHGGPVGVDQPVPDSEPLWMQAQRLFSGAPYRWGGLSPFGCDCSGMLQSVASLAGIELPRDSHQQESALSEIIPFDQRQTDDLVFWPGHVGILKNPDILFHANAHSMDCRLEPLEAVIMRAGQPRSIRRANTNAGQLPR